MAMKVLFLSGSDHSHPAISGAVIRQSFLLSFWDKEFSLTLLDNSYFYHSMFYQYLLKHEVKITFLTFPYLKFLPYKLRLIYHIIGSTFLGLINANKFDIIYSSFTPALFPAAVAIKLLTRKKLIATIQLLDTHHDTKPLLIIKSLLRFADTVLVENKEYFKYVKHSHIYETFHAISPDFKLDPKSPKVYDVCFSGTVDNNRKGIKEFIETAEKLHSKKIIKSALIMTPTKNVSYLKSLISKPDIFVIKQGLTLTEVNYFLNRSRIFLFPSQAESYGLVIGEALKTGLPTVISDIPELIIWRDLAKATKDYFTVTSSLIDNYTSERNKLLENIPKSRLLKLTWKDVAKIESQYINQTLNIT
jgi:hypothetical protein